MKPVRLLFATTLAFAMTGAIASVHAATNSSPKIVIIGDSTVARYDTTKTAMRGWGQVIPDGLKPGVQVTNLAKSGRSTKTFIKEKLLDAALREKADFALIQFGHNDSHGKARPEATDAQTEFKQHLRTYVTSFRDAGTQPVLVTPMHRRLFQDGRPTEELQPYAQAMKEIAAEMNVPLIDLHAMSGELLARLGEAGSEDLFFPKDRTHFAEKGARAMADLVLQGINARVPALREILDRVHMPDK